jgi:hypothetical protein
MAFWYSWLAKDAPTPNSIFTIHIEIPSIELPTPSRALSSNQFALQAHFAASKRQYGLPVMGWRFGGMRSVASLGPRIHYSSNQARGQQLNAAPTTPYFWTTNSKPWIACYYMSLFEVCRSLRGGRSKSWVY